jgi:hypothetical protein
MSQRVAGYAVILAALLAIGWSTATLTHAHHGSASEWAVIILGMAIYVLTGPLQRRAGAAVRRWLNRPWY